MIGDSREPEEILKDPPIPWIAGTVDEVVEQLLAFDDAGVERIMFQHLVHDDLEMVDLLGAEVAPRQLRLARERAGSAHGRRLQLDHEAREREARDPEERSGRCAACRLADGRVTTSMSAKKSSTSVG